MDSITLLSPAKINLTLEILGTRKDGYHLLRSIIQPVDLFDELTLQTESGQGIEVDAEGLKLPEVRENLIYKSAELYLNETKISASLRFKLKKRIPTQAGLGGGSSNAAAALVGLNRIFGSLNTEELLKLAAQIGADVPFFINCRTAIVQGIGEKITVLNDFPLLHYLILIPSFRLSTEQVYKKWDELDLKNKSAMDINEAIEKYKRGEFLLRNDLQPAAISINNKIADLKDLLLELGCMYVSMSGSGTAVFAVFPSGNEANDLSEYLKNSDDMNVFLCKGILGWHRLS